jgi:(2Fe-2S) ferredoxin
MGPVVVVYPDGVWYGGVKQEDVEEIFESHFVNGKPVERLLVPDEMFG